MLVVDLTSDSEEGIGLVARLAGEGEGSAGSAAGSPRTLGFYSHVEADVRERAEAPASTWSCPARAWRAKERRWWSGCCRAPAARR